MKKKLIVFGALLLVAAFTAYRAKAQNAASGTLTASNTYAIANLTGAASGILAWLVTPSGANLASAMTSGITNATLANSAVTIAGTSVSLGGSTSSLPSPGVIGGTTPAAGNFTTLTTTGLFTTLDGIPTTGLGVPIVGWQSALSNSSATSLVTLATAPGAGDYDLVFNLDLHTACTTGTGALTLAFGWTANAARTLTTGSWALPATQGASVPFSGVLPIHVVSGNVTFTPTQGTACSTGTATWDGLVQLRRVN